MDRRLTGPPGLMGETIAPTGRLADDSGVDFGLPFGPARFGRAGSECAAVETVFLHVITKLPIKFRMGPKLCIEDAGGTAAGAGEVGANTIADAESPLRIPTEKVEGGAGNPTPGGVPIVPGPIAIGCVNIEEHVIDEIRDVQI